VLVQQYLPVAILVFLSVALCLALVFISRLLGPFRPSHKKLAPYESGMAPIGPAARRLPIKFYLVAVLFILFDIEVIFLFPWAVILRERLKVFGLIEMGVFIAILLVGYVYVWKKGAFEWE
jgi:NADH-quinone oxidoreductase subunit A